MPMKKSAERTLAVAAIAVAGLAGSVWFGLGEPRQSPVDTVATAKAPTLTPSYLVTVRAPTPAEQAQRDALAQARPAQPVIDLTPEVAIEVAEAVPPSGPLATVVSDVNVRSGPGSKSAALSVASAGSQLAVIGQQDGWTQVSLPDGGNGWIASRFLSQ